MNYHFWVDIYHIKQSQYQILNVLKNCFLVLCRSSGNPFVAGNGNQHSLIWQVQKNAKKAPISITFRTIYPAQAL